MKVILKNPEMGHGPSRTLVGKSGKVYGNSRYSVEHRCQIVEMTLEQFQVASDDLWRATNMVFRRWWPMFVSEKNEQHWVLPPAVSEFQAGYNLAMDGRGLPDDASRAAALGWGYAHPEPGRVIEDMPLFDGLRFKTIERLARDEGIDTTDLRTKDSLITAILAKRANDRIALAGKA